MHADYSSTIDRLRRITIVQSYLNIIFAAIGIAHILFCSLKSPMHYILQHFSAAVLCLVFIAILIILVNGALMLFNNSGLKKLRQEKHEILGIMFGAISLIYSLILAFVIITGWSDYDELNDSVEQETNSLRLIINHASMLPDSLYNPLRTSIAQYAEYVSKNEWSGSDEPMSPVPLYATFKILYHLTPSTDQEKEILTTIKAEMDDTFEYRRERLDHRRSHVPDLVWLILSAGSIITITFSFFFENKSSRLQSFFISLFTAMIAMCLFLVYVLDHPFEGSNSVSKEQYEIISAKS